MTTIRRTLPVTFTDTTGLERFVPAILPLPLEGAVRRYSALSAAQTASADTAVLSVPNLGTGSGSAAAPDSSKAPLLKFDGAFPYLKFDGVDDTLVAASTDTVGTGACTLFAVARHTALPPASSYASAALITSTGGYSGVGGRNAAGNLMAYRGSTLTSSPALAPGTGWHVFVLVLNGASSVIRMDNETETTGNAGSGTFSTGLFALARTTGSTSIASASVDVMEAGMYSGVLDSTQRADLVAALVAQYELA